MCYQSHQLFDWDSFELNGKFKLKTKAHISDHLSSRGRPEIYPTTEIQCGQIGRFNRLWATFRSLWQQLNCPNLPYSCAIFVKVSKSLIFLVKSFLGNFYRHLATFYWSHWSCITWIMHLLPDYRWMRARRLERLPAPISSSRRPSWCSPSGAASR